MLPFPNIDPIMVHIGPVALHWYGMAYVVGLLAGWRYAVWIARCFAPTIPKIKIDDFMVWALAGAIIGGRLGHILFFDLNHYTENPLEIFMTWKGGMSFHGGLIGVVIAAILYCRKKDIAMFRFGDIIASVAPIGLFLGRLANFVNGELYGRVTDAPWAMIFPGGGPLPRHPSQLYEAFLEGMVLLSLLHISWRISIIRTIPGRITGLFFLGYGTARILVEFVREPDAMHSLFGMECTTGQLLSIPMILAGSYFVGRRGQMSRNLHHA